MLGENRVSFEEKCEIVMSGTGGQGLILAGLILAEAAVLYNGLNATHNQSYGPEARGGASRSEMIISKDEIDFAEIESPDVLLVMSQEAYKKYAASIKTGGLLIIDSSYVHDVKVGEDVKIIEAPISEIAINEFNKELVANIVALGLIVSLTGFVSEEAAKQAVAQRVPQKTVELNLQALEKGFELGRKTKEDTY